QLGQQRPPRGAGVRPASFLTTRHLGTGKARVRACEHRLPCRWKARRRVGLERAPWLRFVWSCRECPDPAGRRRVKRSVYLPPKGARGQEHAEEATSDPASQVERRSRVRPRMGKAGLLELQSQWVRSVTAGKDAETRIPVSRGSARSMRDLPTGHILQGAGARDERRPSTWSGPDRQPRDRLQAVMPRATESP